MKTLLKSAVAVLFVTLAATSASFGLNGSQPVPEIDPSMGAGALALIAGGIMVIRGRRRR